MPRIPSMQLELPTILTVTLLSHRRYLAIARVATGRDLISMQPKTIGSTNAAHYLVAWIALYTCLEDPSAELVCECPFVYFFVKFCIDQDLGVPTLALALYDKMNMQLSREFIRCCNPACIHSRMDKSTGWGKFQMCSRCKVAYCSKECQVAYYPKHMKFCFEHAVDKKGA